MNLADKNHCCGCAGCFAVCPFHAIKMQYDEERFIYPIIDENKCKNCGKCESVCPIVNKDKITVNTHNKKIMHGFFKDVDKHRISASGGAATALAEIIIKQGGCVFGSSYSSDYKKAEYVKVENLNKLDLIKSSKYIETIKGNVFSEVKKELVSGRIVLFTGLPCDIGGLKGFLQKNYDNLYTCELICHGPTSQKVQEDFIDKLSKKYKSKVTYFSCRYKKENTEAPYIRVEFENNKFYQKPLWDTEYGHAFAVYSRRSCYHCTFKGDNRVADISVGDSWKARKNFGNQMGVSVIYVHTDKGLELIEQLEDFELELLDYESVKDDNPAIWKSLDETKERKKFAKILKKKNLSAASFRSRNIAGKIKYMVKYMIKK